MNELIESMGPEKYCSICGCIDYQMRPEYYNPQNPHEHGPVLTKTCYKPCFFLVCNRCGKRKIITTE